MCGYTTTTDNSETTVTTYTLNEQNRLTQTEQAMTAQAIIEQYFYDGAGNMLGRRPEALNDIYSTDTGSLGLLLLGDTQETDLTPALYSYNDKNQMVGATNGESIVANTFNAEGLRFSKAVDGVTTYFCYEYMRVIKELDSGGSVAYNTYGTNLISRDLDGAKVYYLYNGHGDVTGLLSSSGAIIATYYYDAFGNIVEESGNFSNPYRYAGYIYDEQSRLYNLNARFYDAKLARFMQEDTYLGSQGDPLSLNLYTYCVNNPLIYFDPTGHNNTLSDWDKANLNSTQQKQVAGAKQDYEYAKSIGDTKGMADAHAFAEKIRSQAAGGGYSGGTDGSSYISTSTNTSSNTGSGSGGGGSGGNNPGGGNARGVTFGENEGADWLRTGSGLSFEEFWGVTPGGTAYYTGFTNTGNSIDPSNAGLWHQGTFTKSSDLIIAPASFENQNGLGVYTYSNGELKNIPGVLIDTSRRYNFDFGTMLLSTNQSATASQTTSGGIFILGTDKEMLQILNALQNITDHTLTLKKISPTYAKVIIGDIAHDRPTRPAGNALIRYLCSNEHSVKIKFGTDGKGCYAVEDNPARAYMYADGTPGLGSGSTVFLDRTQVEKVGVPLGILLGHELVHASRWMSATDVGDEWITYLVDGVTMVTYAEELYVVGIVTPSNYKPITTENELRKEQGLEARKEYIH